MNNKNLSLAVAAFLLTFGSTCLFAATNTAPWVFVSSPDWFNQDVADLSGATPGVPRAEGWTLGVAGGLNGISPQMAQTYDFLVGEMSTYNPQLFVVTGDLINGRWSTTATLDMFDSDTRDRATAIDNAAAIYYRWYRQLFGRFGITRIIPAVGDHELGDNPWPAGSEKAIHLQTMRRAFGREMVTPLGLPNQINGANSRPIGTAFEHGSFAYKHQNVLFISVDVFRQDSTTTNSDPIEGTVVPEVTGAQLTWLGNVLAAAKLDASIDHVIVQGHAPALSPVRVQQSSGIMLREREASPFWQLLRQYAHGSGGKVRLYFGGEVHTVTASKDTASDIVQLVHGNPPWGVSGPPGDLNNYVVFTVFPTRIEARSRRAVLNNNGNSRFWQPDDPQSLGPSAAQPSTPAGSLTIDVSGSKTTYVDNGDLTLMDQVGLVVHFGFDTLTASGNFSNTGSIGNDYYEGIANGGATTGPGMFGSAINLNGIGAFVKSGRGTIVGGDSRTVAAWINTTSTGTRSIVSYGATTSGANSRFEFELGNGRPRVSIGSGINCTPANAPQVNDGAWHHVAVAFTNEHASRCSDMVVYVDGAAYPAGSGNASEVLNTVPWSDIRMGADTKAANLFSGLIDDVAIWGAPLPSARLRALVNAGRHDALRYNAAMMEVLFDLFDLGQGQVSIGSARWSRAAGLPGQAGDVVVHNGVLAIRLDTAGNGVVSDIVWTSSTTLGATVAAVGAKSQNSGNLTDVLADGSQNLSTSWSNDGSSSTAWFTLDLGSVKDVRELRVAPRGDRTYNLEIYIGNTLVSGQVGGSPVAVCTPPQTGAEQPSALQRCPVPATSGRYVTVKSANMAWFKVYGVEVRGVATGGANVAPTANFTVTTTPQSRQASFNASASNDPDGSIVSYAWNFGDGKTGSGVTTTYTWAADGTYVVTLTVTDNQGATATTSKSVTVSSSVNPSAQQFVTVAAVGAKASQGPNLIDMLGNGAQNLSTSWGNDGNASTAWFTLDLGSLKEVRELRVAPRADRNYDLQIYVGSTLTNGQVDGSPVAVCTPPTTATEQPAVLRSCPLPATVGRFVTVKSANLAWFKFYGVEVWGAGTGGGNVAPTAAFTATTTPQSRQASFNASASNDPDGSIVSYAWNFGDGNTGSGVTTTYTWAADGTYVVTLTVTDNQGATATTNKSVTVTSSVGTAANLPVTVAAVGAKASQGPNLIDVLGDGSQNLATSWGNDGNASTAWFTLDLGAVKEVRELRVAPRADRAYDLQIYVGNTLTNGQVDGAPVAVCTPPTTATEQPSVLRSCPLTATSGRFVMVKTTDKAWLKFYGIEVWGAGPSGGNIVPTAAFTATTNPGSLSASLNASASNDPDGTLISYSWNFGDGSLGTGVTTNHTWLADGTYLVTLTVMDDRGATATTSQSVTVSSNVNPLAKLPVTVAATGAKASQGPNLIDVLGNGSQNLSTYWSNNGVNATAWFTLDLGSAKEVREVRVAPRSDWAHVLNIFVGNTLVNGQADGSPVTVCTPSPQGPTEPSQLEACAVPTTTGRYVTVKLVDKDWFRFYGVEVWGN